MQKKRLRIKDPKLKELVQKKARRGSKREFFELIKHASKPKN